MFENFIYFIIVLLVYSTYQGSGESNPAWLETLVLFSGLALGFWLMTRYLFQRLERQFFRQTLVYMDHRFNQLMTRQCVGAIFLFAVNIYGLNLSGIMRSFPLFLKLPTLEGVFFLGVFIAYISIVWAYGYKIYKKLYGSRLSRWAYVRSNISFALPVLLPWLVLSSAADLINLSPFDSFKHFLETPHGQALYFLIFLVGIAMIGPILIQKFWRCTPLESGQHRTRIENLCRRANLKYADILYWPIFEGRIITAGVMGLIKWFRYILVTEALLEMLRPEELEAVIAHEIGHIKRCHLLFYVFFFVGYAVISYTLVYLMLLLMIYAEPFYNVLIQTGISQTVVHSGFFALIHILTFLIYFRYIFGYFMRNFERQADGYIYTLFNNAAPLIRTFEKIILSSGESPDKPNWHHFSVSERVKYLQKCEQDKTWLARHDRKMRRSIAVYLVALTLFSSAGYALNFGETGEKISSNFIKNAIYRQIEKHPSDPELYRLLGDIYYDKKAFEKAVKTYEKGRSINPNMPEILNNLAWIYSTCEIKNLRKPKQALILAQKAASISFNKPHILDTLAEAYYANGQIDMAISTSQKALALAAGDQSHYKAQLKKFQQAKKNH